MTEEKWLPVTLEGFSEVYEISTHGRVKSLARVAKRRGFAATQTVRERILRPGKHPFGYDIVCLKNAGAKKMERVHKLVALAFIPNPMGYPNVNHIDNDTSNNHVENLEWCDQAHNIGHASKQGRMGKLTWEKVALIRAKHKNGSTLEEIAATFGVTKQCIWFVVRNITWKMPTS